MNQLPSARLDLNSDKVADIYAVCVNCNKRFTSIRAISMHLKGAIKNFTSLQQVNDCDSGYNHGWNKYVK
jgi:hypothetical protein